MTYIDNGFEDCEVIFKYTREQAIADGVLVDLMQGELGKLVKDAGVKYPMAMTATAFNQFVDLTPTARKVGNDIKGRLWDILTMFRYAIRRSIDDQEIIFKFLCVVNSRKPTLCFLKATIGPDDNGSPCITLMLPNED